MSAIITFPRPRTACGRCYGSRLVEAASGELRPCSRCSIDAFTDWATRRRPVPDASVPEPLMRMPVRRPALVCAEECPA